MARHREKTEQHAAEKPQKAPSFALWASLLTAIALIAVCAFAVLFPKKPEADADGIVDLHLREWETVDFTVRETPEPTAEPIDLPIDAVDVLIDLSRTALTLASKPEAEALLTDYLAGDTYF